MADANGVKGLVFDIQRFSVHDGPGIRTTVFLKGCPLQCFWCHNPEGLSARPELRFWAQKCIGCGACTAVCDVHGQHDGRRTVAFDRCRACGACVRACPAQALELCGAEYTAEQIAAVAMRDLDYYGDDGGVTFSGGECLLQAAFVQRAAGYLLEHTPIRSVAIDTSGAVDRSAFEAVLPFCDWFLYDVKAAGDEAQRHGTGAGNARILENLRWLDGQRRRIWVRVPVIPGFNDNDDEMERIAELVASLRSAERVTLMPYHGLGREKYETLGLTSACSPGLAIPKEQMDRWVRLFLDHGIHLTN